MYDAPPRVARPNAGPSERHPYPRPRDREPPPEHEPPPPSRYSSGSAISVALCEAVGRIVEQRGGGRVASPQAMAEAGGAERGGRREPLGGDPKKVAMRLCAMVESYGGRLEEVTADPRARAELEAIIPGLDEEEFRAMLGGCVERSQVMIG